MLTLALATASASAEVYKWVEDGTVHYGNTPPAGQQAESVKTPAGPPKARTENARETLDERIEQDEEWREQEADEQEQARGADQLQEARKQNCDNARKALQQLENSRRLQYINDEGERAFLTEKQRQQRMDEARKLMQKNCGQR